MLAPVQTATDVAYLGMVTFPTGTEVLGTELGGLSAIAYDPTTNRFYFLSDDRAELGPVRLYQATVALEDGGLTRDDVAWEAVVELHDRGGLPFARNTLDPEGLVWTGNSFWVASEGNGAWYPPIPPALIEFSPTGEWLRDLPMPDAVLPTANQGVRNNQAFEALVLTPDGTTLIAGIENALRQDGPSADVGQASPTRLIAFDLTTGKAQQQWLYLVEPVPFAPNPPSGNRDNGLVEMVLLAAPTDTGADTDTDADASAGLELLTLERSYAQGVGVTARIFRVKLTDASDVRDLPALAQLSPEALAARAVSKELMIDVSSFGLLADNLEGMALGPKLENGRQTLLLVSDNNFSSSQRTQILAFALPAAEE
jgi:3-phytase/alkaline phosphatase D